jgi:hypothetical protein
MREYDFLNPAHSVAKMTNWREAEIDGRVVTTWSGQWENVHGDVLVYGLSFRSAPGRTFDDQQEPTGPLYVTVTYLGAQLVRGIAEEVERERDTPALGSSGAERDGAQTLNPTLQFKTATFDYEPKEEIEKLVWPFHSA